MSLWLTLTLKEKLEMLVHQRIMPELELMHFLLEAEYDLSKNIGNSDKMDLQMERTLDQQIYSKYFHLAKFSAINKSVQLCHKRLQEISSEDRQLVEYMEFLEKKSEDYKSVILQLKAEVERSLKRNEKLTSKLAEDQARKAGSKRLEEQTRHMRVKGSAAIEGDEGELEDSPGFSARESAMSRRLKKPFSVSIRSQSGIGGGSRRSRSTSTIEKKIEDDSSMMSEYMSQGYEAPNDSHSGRKHKSGLAKK